MRSETIYCYSVLRAWSELCMKWESKVIGKDKTEVNLANLFVDCKKQVLISLEDKSERAEHREMWLGCADTPAASKVMICTSPLAQPSIATPCQNSRYQFSNQKRRLSSPSVCRKAASRLSSNLVIAYSAINTAEHWGKMNIRVVQAYTPALRYLQDPAGTNKLVGAYRTQSFSITWAMNERSAARY